MKNFYKIFILALFSFLIVHCTLNIEPCSAQWVQMSNGMGNKIVISLAYSGNNIVAGTTDAGLFLSTNNGTNWIPAGFTGQIVASLAVNGNNIFAGTYSYGVYLSTNNGTSWSQTSLNNRDISSIAINGNNIFAGTFTYGVYLSTNNGTNWTQTSLNNLTIYSLTVNGSNVLAGCGSAYGVYLSTNNGTNWAQTFLNNRLVFSLAANGSNIFAGTGSNYGVYLSTNNGGDWTQTSLNNRTVYSFAVNGNNIFAGTGFNYGVYVSSNNGTNWTQRNEGLGNLNINAFCLSADYIFAGTYSSVYRRPLSEFITSMHPVSKQIPEFYSLEQNYPNPFNPTTKVQFSIVNVQYVTLKIFDILGREIKTLVEERLKPGKYEVNFDGTNYPSGIYYYQLMTGDYLETKKMMLVK